MTHPEDLLADYVRGSLTPSELATVEEHLSTCPSCTADVALAREARAALRALPQVPSPDGVTSQALERAGERRGGRPGGYRWLGAAAAAAVVALLVVTVQHRAPRSSEAAREATALAGSGADNSHPASPGSFPQLVVQQATDYDQTTLNALARAVLGKSSSAAGGSMESTAATPAQTGRPGTDVESAAAVACIARAVPPDAGTPFRLLLARFNGEDAYLAFYSRGPTDASPSVVVWIVDSHTCIASGLSSAGT